MNTLMEIKFKEAMMKKESMKNKESASKKPMKHSDVKQDKKMVKGMVKKSCLK